MQFYKDLKYRAFSFDGLRNRKERLIYLTIQNEIRQSIIYNNELNIIDFRFHTERSVTNFFEKYTVADPVTWKYYLPIGDNITFNHIRRTSIKQQFLSRKKELSNKPKSTSDMFVESIL